MSSSIQCCILSLPKEPQTLLAQYLQYTVTVESQLHRARALVNVVKYAM